RSDRTRLPAELLDLPAHPVDGFSPAPFDDPAVRDLAIAAARARAAGYVDGSIEKQRDRFRVELIVRATTGDREIARGIGEDASLHDAISKAMVPLASRDGLGVAPAIDASVTGWMHASSTDLALLAADFDIANSDYEIDDERRTCKRILARR